MHLNETKFVRNSSLEYYHMTSIGKTKQTSYRGLLPGPRERGARELAGSIQGTGLILRILKIPREQVPILVC